MRVIKVTLFVIVEDFIGLLNGFEADLRRLAFFFGRFIGMMGEGGLSFLSKNMLIE
jgi:hypothetical protein